MKTKSFQVIPNAFTNNDVAIYIYTVYKYMNLVISAITILDVHYMNNMH